jgi:DNA-binding transcriptional MerR regulator
LSVTTHDKKAAGDVRIGEVSARLGVSPTWIRTLEEQQRIPAARFDRAGRLYSEVDIALLERIGIGQRPERLLRPEEID